MLAPLKESLSPEEEDGPVDGSVFATKDAEEEEPATPEVGTPDTFEELPIEIRSLTERYETVQHPSIELFSDFYQISRIAIRQSPQEPRLRRRTLRPVPGVLLKSIRTYQHAHSNAFIENIKGR